MKIFRGFYKFLKGLTIKKNPKFLVIYGNYGGAGYSARSTFISGENKIYILDNNNQFTITQEMTMQDYCNYYLKLFQDIDVEDELDACFKLHDLDTNTTNLKDIIKASHALPINMGKIDPVFYLVYPIVFITGVFYFSIFNRVENFDENDLIHINEYRSQCRNIYSDKYNIKYI
ncbi:hypothetical protein [Moumouvirus maliensis]|nr:hypothetical protein [Moumouvirus maliensis]